MTDVSFEVRINGQSISTDIRPVLEEITTFDGTDNESDTASITVADVDGRVFMADERDTVQIDLGTAREGVGLVFDGFVSDVRSRGSRSKGRTITIECKSVDPGGRAKEEQERHWDDQDLGTILNDAFKPTGIPILVAPSFAKVIRDYEAMDGESPLAFARRLAEETGATFKMMGARAVFTERSAGLDVMGGTLPVFRAAWGNNLLDWDLTPIVPKSRYADTRSRWYDFQRNEWQEEAEEISTGEARQLVAAIKPNAGLAKQSAIANRVASDRKGGRGSITVRGNCQPQADGKCEIVGARPGIDGVYIINSVQHTMTRSQGYTTQLDLRKPEGSAGKDSRIPVPTPRPAA